MSRKRKRRRTQSVAGMVPPAKSAAEQTVPGRRGLPEWLPPATAVVLVLASGIAYGVLTHRWSNNDDVVEAASRIDRLPRTIGGWEGRDLEISQRMLDQAGAVGSLSRVYRHIDGREIQVMILCGHPGPISLHPPTICFTSAGWSVAAQARSSVTAEKQELGAFEVAVFRKQSSAGEFRMTTYWAWNADGRWQAPQRPRYAFAGSTHLFKIYVSTVGREAAGNQTTSADGQETVEEFLPLLIPALRKIGI